MLKIGLIGCGHISETYFRSRDYFNNINITTCADLNQEAANKCANEYNIVPKSVDDILADLKSNTDDISDLLSDSSNNRTINIKGKKKRSITLNLNE